MISSSKQSQRFNLNCSSGKDCMSNFMTFLMIISCDFGIMCMSHKHQPPVFSTALAPPKVYIKIQKSCRVHPDFTVTTIWGSLQFFHQQTGELKLSGEAFWGFPKNWSKNTKNIVHSAKYIFLYKIQPISS